MKERVSKAKRIACYGHFDATNFGNESSLQALLYNLRRFQPDAEVICISTGPEATVATHHIEAVPIAERYFRSWIPRNPVAKTLRKILIGLPSEPYRWVKGLVQLRHVDMLIVPGTGLLTDAYGLLGYGPYSLLKWSLIAKLRGCKLLLVSVGAGPIYGGLGRWCVKWILSLADFRSYRDNSTLQYLTAIGFREKNDSVYPDLAFSLPETVMPQRSIEETRRPVIGLGVMEYAGKYSVADPSDQIYLAYLENLVAFARWLLARGYNIRLLIGDLADLNTKEQFKDLLMERLSGYDKDLIIDEPISSVQDLLSQIAATDVVVATRFHNVLLSLFFNKPVISVSFHHKCESLMGAIGLSEYCLSINDLEADQLIDRFCDLERNLENIKSLIEHKTAEFREALNEQYQIIFSGA